MANNSLLSNKHKKGNGALDKKMSNNLSKTPDQTYCLIGIKIRCVSDTIISVSQNFKSLNKADASVFVALDMFFDSKIVKGPQSLLSVDVSKKNQSLELYGNKKKLKESPRHKKLKVCAKISCLNISSFCILIYLRLKADNFYSVC